MLFIWFWLVAAMITAYVVLDGFDLGAGALHLIIAKTDQERQTVIRTIGPVWDGNEVWLLAGGGTLFFAFPLLYASGFSGFYLPLMIVLWLLILRGIGIELRMHLNGTVWRGFFDGCFAISSLLLTVFFGAALGNVVRGVPLNKEGYFFSSFVDQLEPWRRAGNFRLVYGNRRRGCAGRFDHAWSTLCGGENVRQPEPARPPGGRSALARACAGDTAEFVGHAHHTA
jgi:cytochrome d oxidase subunit CydB